MTKLNVIESKSSIAVEVGYYPIEGHREWSDRSAEQYLPTKHKAFKIF